MKIYKRPTFDVRSNASEEEKQLLSELKDKMKEGLWNICSFNDEGQAEYTPMSIDLAHVEEFSNIYKIVKRNEDQYLFFYDGISGYDVIKPSANYKFNKKLQKLQ